jgi:methyl-accepting chemotaxis protein
MALIFGILMWIAFKISKSVGEVTQAIEQLSAAGHNLSESSTEAAALSQSSRNSAEKGEKEIKNLVESMLGISQVSKKIAEIIHVIDDIAFQTNLLALNAAVEAAKEITTLIKDSVSQIENGTSLADNSGVVMAEIVSSVKKVADLATEIASTAQEISSQAVQMQQLSEALNVLVSGSSEGQGQPETLMRKKPSKPKLSVVPTKRKETAPPAKIAAPKNHPF